MCAKVAKLKAPSSSMVSSPSVPRWTLWRGRDELYHYPLQKLFIGGLFVFPLVSDKMIEEKTERDGKLDEQVAQIFALFDKDDDGRIAGAEVAPLLRALNRAPSQESVERLATKYPTITLANLEALLKECPPVDVVQARQELLQAFRILDRACTGRVNGSELRRLLTTVGGPSEQLTAEEADDLLRLADPQNTGLVDYTDFVQKLLV
jgi:Ca2+-binding EF-hand superfamily protein